MSLGIGGIVSLGGTPGSGTSGSGSSSGVTKFAASFTNITSGIFTHGFGTTDVIVQVQDNRSPSRVIMPDYIIISNSNQVSITFNVPKSGRIIII